MQSILVMFRSSGERRSFSVTREITVIGRREDCDLIIPLGEVSRKHCRLVRDGDLLKLEDLGSANGTFLNGQRVQESLLAPGDTVQVGPVVFVLQLDGVPADDELQPVYAEGAALTGGAVAGSAIGDVDVHSGHPEEDALDGLEPLEDVIPAADAGEGSGLDGLEPIDLDDDAAAPPPMPKRVPPPVPPGLQDEPVELDELEPVDEQAEGDLGGEIPLDDLEPEADAPEDGAAEDHASANGDGLGDLDLLEIEPEHEEPRRA